MYEVPEEVRKNVGGPGICESTCGCWELNPTSQLQPERCAISLATKFTVFVDDPYTLEFVHTYKILGSLSEVHKINVPLC